MVNPVTLPEQFGRYRILRKLGGGGMGTVYLAEDTELGRKVALKVPHFTADDAIATERFKREARIAAGIDHANLCPVYDVGQVGGTPYFTMPYIEGRQLSRWIKEQNVWEPQAAAQLVRKLALALGVMHERGQMHRDLKPSNVLVQPSGEPVLVDFGLARSFDGKTQTLTETGERLGTPAYMSPEQVLGDAKKIGPATDIYSLGMILYELVTGKLPFTGPPMAMYGQILHAKLPPPSVFRPGLDGQIDALCLKALAKKAEDRFSSMTAFADALAGYAERVPVPAAVPVAASKPTATHGSAPTGGKGKGEGGKGADSATAPVPAVGEPELIEEVHIVCSKCKRQFHVPPEYRGKRMKCPRCGTSLGTGPGSGAVPAVSPTPRPSATGPLTPAPRQPEPEPPLLLPAEAETAANRSVDTLTNPPWRQRLRENPLILAAAGFCALLLLVGFILLLGNSGSPSTEVDKGDEKKSTPKQTVTLNLSPVEPLYRLTAGQPGKLSIRVKRDKVQGAIELRLVGAPPGIRARRGGGFIPSGEEVGELNVETELGARPGISEATVLAIAGEGKGETKVRLAVEMGIAEPTFTNSIGMKFVLVRRGTFLMGSPNTEASRETDEDQHEVEIPCSFYLGTYEVTQEEYEKVMGPGTNPSRFTESNDGGLTHPVEMVSYEDAEKFCRRLSELDAEKKARRVYRLPTEAEWEYACRAGTKGAYSFGNDPTDLGNYAWFDDNSEKKSHPVGMKTANNWGLFDMDGNVREWCKDWYDPDYYKTSPKLDPRGPEKGNAEIPARVTRGGSWKEQGNFCRSGCRGSKAPNGAFDDVGFRVVLIIGLENP